MQRGRPTGRTYVGTVENVDSHGFDVRDANGYTKTFSEDGYRYLVSGGEQRITGGWRVRPTDVARIYAERLT